MKQLSLTYSLADQEFGRTKSIGIFNVSTALAAALAAHSGIRKLTLLTNPAVGELLPKQSRVEICATGNALGGRLRRILWDQWGVYSKAKRVGNEWLLLPKGFASFVRKPPVFLAAYVHDMMHDVYADKYPGQSLSLEAPYFRRSVLATIRNGNLIVTNSEFTAGEVRRVARKYNLPVPNVRCAGIGFNGSAPPRSPRANGIVMLTSRLPHKRSDLAVEWLRNWERESQFKGEIDIIGGLPAGADVPAHWRQHERLAESEFRQVMRQAGILIYFSEYEGFGIPPVEAVIEGICPVFSSIPVTREVMEDTGRPFSNEDYGTFRDALDSALLTRPETIAAWSAVLLARYQWPVVADRIVNAMLDVM